MTENDQPAEAAPLTHAEALEHVERALAEANAAVSRLTTLLEETYASGLHHVDGELDPEFLEAWSFGAVFGIRLPDDVMDGLDALEDLDTEP